jgi:hypothetical protein
MIEIPLEVVGAEFDERPRRQAEAGLVRDADRFQVALPVLREVDGRGLLRRRERLLARHLAGNALLDVGGVDVEARLGVLRQPEADVQRAAHAFAVAVLAEAVRLLPGAGHEIIDRAGHGARAGRELAEAEAADVEARAEEVGVVAGGHDEVDGAAERVGAEAQRVGPLVHLDVAVGGRVDLLEIAVAVGGVDRDAVHVELDGAQVEVARQPRAADREARILAPLRLHEHAGNIVERVLEGHRGRRALVGRIRHDLDRAGRARDLGRGLSRRGDREAAGAASGRRRAGCLGVCGHGLRRCAGGRRRRPRLGLGRALGFGRARGDGDLGELRDGLLAGGGRRQHGSQRKDG